MHLKRYLAFAAAFVFTLSISLATYAAQQLDQYGGTTSVRCPNGPAPHFYTQEIGNRWWLCDPLGNGFFLKGVYDVVPNTNSDSLATKYAAPLSSPSWQSAIGSSTANWALEQLRRLQLWGFNVTADYSLPELSFATDPAWVKGCTGSGTPYSWCTGSGTGTNGDYPPILMPYEVNESITHDAFVNNNGCDAPSPLKDIMHGVGAAYTGWQYNFGDYFDPNFTTCVANVLAADTYDVQPGIAAAHNDYLVYITIDESDNTGPLDQGADFETIGENGLPGSGAQAASHISWTTLASAPIQASNSDWSATYTSEEVYSKVALADQMANEYLCTATSTPLSCCTGAGKGNCSVDPNTGVGTAIDGSNMTTATKALNTAWGSAYTTLSTSDSHCRTNLAECLAGNAACTASGAPYSWCAGRGTGSATLYSSFGKGTGLLDENGACPSKGAGNCWMGDPCTLTTSSAANSCSTGVTVAETTAMQTDMSAFSVAYLDQYFSVMKSNYNAAAPGYLLQMQLGGWGAPPRKEVLTEAAKYLTLPIVSSVPSFSPPCSDCTDQQARIDFVSEYLGNFPYINWVAYSAQPDSAESAYATSNPGTYSTQAARGTAYQGMVSAFVNAKDTATGTYHIVGFDWWGMYDMDSQKSNWGLLTPLDNPYDGTSATIDGINGKRGNDQWGYSTGGEKRNYGSLIGSVKTANDGVYQSLAH